MDNKSYQLSYLSLFEQSLISTTNHITNVLKNVGAALPRIYVRNYVIYYVVHW